MKDVSHMPAKNTNHREDLAANKLISRVLLVHNFISSSHFEISRYEPLVLQESSVMNRFPRNTKDQGPVIPVLRRK